MENQHLIFVSYPRGGSNMLLQYIEAILISNNINVSRCNYYPICRGPLGNSPKSKKMFEKCECNRFCSINKTHQIVKINEKFKYIVLLRKNKYENIEAYIRMKCFIEKKDYNLAYLKRKKQLIKEFNLYYEDFYKNYFENNYDNILKIYTEDLINDTENLINKIFIFLLNKKIDDLNFKNYLEIQNFKKRMRFNKIDEKNINYIKSVISSI